MVLREKKRKIIIRKIFSFSKGAAAEKEFAEEKKRKYYTEKREMLKLASRS